MTFTRLKADNWHREVPGARWFKADLHIHTIDDHAGRRAKLPSGINGPVDSPQTISAYAHEFLKSAVAAGVNVLGITPHSPRVGTGPDTSAVWEIVEQWNTGSDDDGKPFREQIYAVFPGFEPLLKEGHEGLHLLFLFDPEVGRERYLKAFDLVMGGLSPWPSNQLRMSNRSSQDALQELRDFHRRESSGGHVRGWEWNYITLAPHIDGNKGLYRSQRAQVLDQFDHREIAGLELSDGKLPEDMLVKLPGLADRMSEYRQAFYHGSDAYKVGEIGQRHTWVKLATPRVEAVRQAFIASDSRVRLGYRRDGNGELEEIPDPPDVTINNRPWLKSVVVTGKASFFGGNDASGQGSRFDLSPDLTCIIGGSMTGKSTLLDGLRVHVGAPLPDNDALAEQVRARGQVRFLGGSAKVELNCPGTDTTAPLHQRWPAIFYTQNELQELARNPGAVEDILARLVAPETVGIEDRESRLAEVDGELRRTMRLLADLGQKHAEAEQAVERSRMAVRELEAFADAGVAALNSVSGKVRRWRESSASSNDLSASLGRVLESLESLDPPEVDASVDSILTDAGIVVSRSDLQGRWVRIREQIQSAKVELDAASSTSRIIADALEAHQSIIRVQVNRALAERGMDAARINQFQALNTQASLLGSYEAHMVDLRGQLNSAESLFEASIAERQATVNDQRTAFDRIIHEVQSQFNGQIDVERVDDGLNEPIDRFLRGLGQRGITRWWNELPVQIRPAPHMLLHLLEANQLSETGMSGAVQTTFQETMTAAKQRELAALRCRDLYVLKLKLDDGNSRQLDKLSGGQRVNLLLSLLLETNDDRPLVIDQPEDELDNRFLFDTMLPVLKRLKGRRQVILTTHDANIVVNGDADQVIQLEAESDRGRVALAGAIEAPLVRDAIVKTVDGGDEAFRQRRLKYGF